MIYFFMTAPVFVVARELSLVAARASRGGFSCCGAGTLGMQALAAVVHSLSIFSV